MKFSPKPAQSPRRKDPRTVLVLAAVLGLQVIICGVLVAAAFPEWRPSFLGGKPEAELPVLGAVPSAAEVGLADSAPPPADAAASRMLFGSPGSAVLGKQVPTAPQRTVEASNAPGSALPRDPLSTSTHQTVEDENLDPIAQMAAQRYLEWLRTVELERQSLRLTGEQHLSDASDGEAGTPFPRRQPFRLAAQELRSFQQRILRIKPLVPADFRIVDQYYQGAVEQEGAQTSALLTALEMEDRDEVRQLQRRGTAAVDRDLTVANAKLEQWFRQRGEPVTLRLSMGQEASLLGVLTAR